MMNSVLFFVASFVLKMTVSQTFSHTTLLGEGNSLTVQCSTTDFSGTVYFRIGTDDKGGCLIGDSGLCQSEIDGYNTPTRQDTTITKMTIASCNETRDTGSWTCTYGALTSPPVEISSCSGDTSTPTGNTPSTTPGSKGTNTPTKKYAIASVIHAGCSAIAYIIVMAMCALRNFIRSTGKISGKCFLTFCQFIEDKFFDCCGNKNSKKMPIEECLPRTTTSSVVVKGDPDFIKDNVLTLMPKEECLPRTTTPSVVVKGDPDFIKDKVLTLNWLLGFTYLVLYGVIVEVIVLIGVYYGHSKFQEGLVIGVGFVSVLVVSGLCLLVVWMLKKFFKNDASEKSRSQSCISLRNGTVTPDERQQPDGDEGIQSTPTEIHTRLSTTPRPLPPRPDIASKPQGTLDSLNSHIVLAPIENPNIPPSIDTLDEQKTDKKPKDKKKKKKKKKDVEQDNPGTGQ